LPASPAPISAVRSSRKKYQIYENRISDSEKLEYAKEETLHQESIEAENNIKLNISEIRKELK
jgi:hypothetical protein